MSWLKYELTLNLVTDLPFTCSRATTMDLPDFLSVLGRNRIIVHTGARIITKIVGN